jgi:NAD(P)-dependent dehydrogenase (short-subunit alcohol dehydrogenase family)
MPQAMLQGRVVLVTGVSSGLGAHFCAVLKSQGAVVIGLSRRPPPQSLGIDLSLQADVSHADSVQSALDRVDTFLQGNPLYGLINNAGIAVTAPLHDTAPDDFARVVATNLGGVAHMTRAAVPLLRRAAGSVIVNIASVLGLRPLRDVSVYSATKAGVIQLTRSAAIELARDQIRVNALAPGYVRTDINTEVLDGPAGDALKKKTPLRRFALPNELNAPFLLLLDPGNSYMTGSTLVVDGGMSAGL